MSVHFSGVLDCIRNFEVFLEFVGALGVGTVGGTITRNCSRDWISCNWQGFDTTLSDLLRLSMCCLAFRSFCFGAESRRI